jgi:hypothetical protein
MLLQTKEEKLDFIATLRREKLEAFSTSERGRSLTLKMNDFPGINIQQDSLELYDTVQALKALSRKREEERQRYLPRFVLSWALAVLSLMIVAVTDISFLASVWFIALPVAALALIASVVFLKTYIPKIRQTHQALEKFDVFEARKEVEAVHFDDIILIDALRDALRSLGSAGHDFIQTTEKSNLKSLSGNFMSQVVKKRRLAQDEADIFYTKGAAATGLALGAVAFAVLPALEFMLGTTLFFPPDIIFVIAVVALIFVLATVAACFYASQYYVEKHTLDILDGAPVKALEAQHSRMFQPVQLVSCDADTTEPYDFDSAVFERA